MSKIIQAVNAMISNKEQITQASQGSQEFFFLYKNKYKWSIRRDSGGDYILWYYPGTESILDLAQLHDQDWENVPMVAYKTKDIGTKEAHSSFAELYGIVKERIYGMNDVLDDIIAN